MKIFNSTVSSKLRFPRRNRAVLFPILALGLMSFPSSIWAQAPVNLGAAANFGILAGSTITDAGGASMITGNVGLYPTTGAAIGLTVGQVHNGTIFTAETSGPLLNTAQMDLTAAYNDAASRAPTLDYGSMDNPLGGQTLFPGVYRFGHAATANLIGTLTLDANGIANPVWIFQATSDFVTAAGAPGSPASEVVLVHGAQAGSVFWEVGSSATIGTYSDLAGTIMADQSITMNTGAQLSGSVLARIAKVSLDHNIIRNPLAVPEQKSAAVVAGVLLATALVRRSILARSGQDTAGRASCP